LLSLMLLMAAASLPPLADKCMLALLAPRQFGFVFRHPCCRHVRQRFLQRASI
jgi:hypothetical protein